MFVPSHRKKASTFAIEKIAKELAFSLSHSPAFVQLVRIKNPSQKKIKTPQQHSTVFGEKFDRQGFRTDKKFIFDMLNQTKNEGQHLTMCKFKSGRSGMPAAVFRSLSHLYADRKSHANPLQNLVCREAMNRQNKVHCML